MDMDVESMRLIQEQGGSSRAGVSTYRVMLLAAICIVLTVLHGCRHGGTTNTTQDSTTATSGDVTGDGQAARTSSEQILFDAIVAELESRGYTLETVSEQFYTVITSYEDVSARLRKRRIVKIIVLPRGGALNVRVSYERDGGEESWTEVSDERTRERASKEEMELARAIEERFHVLQRERR